MRVAGAVGRRGQSIVCCEDGAAVDGEDGGVSADPSFAVTSAATEGTLWLGQRRTAAAAPDGVAIRITVPAAALLRHMLALGSSGSGKTVLSKVVVEECARQGVAAICIDPQGDIAISVACWRRRMPRTSCGAAVSGRRWQNNLPPRWMW